MANEGRKYAEGLVGSLNRLHYDTQRDVAKKAYETNWEDLQNQYKNLQEQLKQRQEQANRDYANGLVQVAENSFDRMRSADNNMVSRGLTTSGLNNLTRQADTTAKGEEVLKLLDDAGNIAVQIGNQLKSGNETYADKATNLADSLADTLGSIGARDLSAQLEYNTGLAELAGAKDARDMENDLAAQQRALTAASNARSKELSGYNDKIKELQERIAINDIITDKDLTDSQKATTLKIMFGKMNAEDILKAYQKNITATEDFEKELKELEKQYSNQKGKEVMPSPTNSNRLTYDSKNSKKYNNLYEDIYNNSIANNSENVTLFSEILDKKATDYRRNGITYEELAELLYGK